MTDEERASLVEFLRKQYRGKLWEAFNRLGMRFTGNERVFAGPEGPFVVVEVTQLGSPRRVFVHGRHVNDQLACAIANALRDLLEGRRRAREQLIDACSPLGVKYEGHHYDALSWDFDAEQKSAGLHLEPTK